MIDLLQKPIGLRTRHLTKIPNLCCLDGSMTQGSQELASIIDIRDTADRNARHRRKIAGRWNVAHYSVGIASVVLAAVAGVGSLGDIFSKDAAAYIALGAAVFAALATFLNSASQRDSSRAANAAWLEVADTARVELLRLQDLPDQQLKEEGRMVLRDLHARVSRHFRGDFTPDAPTG